MVKGLGYALEAIVAMLTLVIFSFGALQIADFEQDWTQYQREVAAQDLAYSLETSGHTSNFVSRGETGSIQTAMTTVSDRDLEVSGLISEIPVTELNIGFYTGSDERYTENLQAASSGSCAGELGELEAFSSDPILETDGGLESTYGVTLYFGNTNATGNARPGYDALWVDNGTSCQFGADEGPYYIDEIFYWGDSGTGDPSNYFDFKDVMGSSNAEFYEATQPVEILNQGSPGPNDIRTDLRPDMVDENDLRSNSYDMTVFREDSASPDDSLDFLNDNSNLAEDLIKESPMLLLMSLQSESDITGNNFLSKTGIAWIGTGYKDGYGGGLADASFSSESESIDVETFYNGLDGDTNFRLRPPGQAISNKSGDLSPARTIYSNQERYDYSSLQQNDTSMSPSGSDPVVPDTYCGDISYTNPRPNDQHDLTEGTINFPNYGNVNIQSVKLGQSESFCEDQIERGIIFGFEDKLYLNGETVEIGGIEYIVDANVDITQEPNCDDWGECANFIPSNADSNDFVELMITRQRLQDIENTERFALGGYQASYNQDQRKALMSTIFWLSGDARSFEGREDPQGVESLSIGNIEGPAYMPYSIYMRWSQ